jgi:hypothetical protein
MTVRRLLLGCAAAIAASGAGLAASASTTIGLDFADASVGFRGFDSGEFTVGYAFKDRVATSVVGLGTYDSSLFVGNGTVGLWNSAGNLLASTTVDLTGTPVGIAPWVFSPIAPVALTPGQTYYVGFFGDAYYATQVKPISTDPHINYLHAATSNFGSSFSFPSINPGRYIDHAYFGGNIQLSSPATPEPSAWAMMLTGLAALGAALRRRASA